eukprot:gnl/Dysnectes_brevis/6450_a10014_351.p1 GENE.gnl/Dysnectes_brevis/6450_a10014_351~~gnl/Dysnectes_brevis/6450_a10014_351.p1  ORF type:complete len:274 (+),score=6.92 gnl/Dysnectes_brevis/6450_a10014_351:110-823(+)
MKLLTISRSQCPRCSRRCNWFCGHCILLSEAMVSSELLLPSVSLPFTIDVHHSASEHANKSTIQSMSLLTPNIQLKTLGDTRSQIVVPEHYNPSNTICLFPSEDALTVSQVNWDDIQTVVVLDTSWAQTIMFKDHPVLSTLPVVRLGKYKTGYWRSHKQGGQGCLCSAEALYYLLKEIKTCRSDYLPGSFDDLLLFYTAQWLSINRHMSIHNRELARGREGYCRWEQAVEALGEPPV